MNNDSCEQCGKVAELVFVGYDELCPKCANFKEFAQQKNLEAEMQRDRDYYNSLGVEAQEELRAEYAMAGVSDAREWFGY